MKHLNDEQLGAQLDGARGAGAEEAARHLDSCEACRGRLAELASQDRALARALDHDPGEAYFASFADRVAARIAAPASERATASVNVPWWTPRRLAWAGGALALALVAALAVVLSRDNGPATMASKLAPRTEVGGGSPHAALKSAPAPAATRSLEREAAPAPVSPRAQAPAPSQLSVPAPSHAARLGARDEVTRKAQKDTKLRALDARGNEGAPVPTAAPTGPANAKAEPRADASSGRAVEVKTLPNGEQVVVTPPNRPAGPNELLSRRARAFLKPPPEPARPGFATPPQEGAPAPAIPATGTLQRPPANQALSREEASSTAAPFRICGAVRGPSGAPLAGATVSIAETGASATSGPDGSFCLQASGERATLTAFAIGYQPYRAGVTLADSGAPWTATLLPVETLAPPTGGNVADDRVRFRKLGTTAIETVQRAARDATRLAARQRTPEAWERAAGAWSEVAAAADAPATRLEARFHVAEARMGAWRLAPTAARRAAAAAAIDTYVAAAPRGPLRDLAEGWKRELGA
jgi:hypothetical protein